MLLPVVMSGGSGTRLWPLSRKLYPKQFLPLVNNDTMFQNTVSRVQGISGILPPIVICNEEHRFIVAEQLRSMDSKSSGILLEPIGKNTAPAVAVAALHAISKGEDPILLVLAADHDIKKPEVFQQVVEAAIPAAEDGKLITFGIVPTAPETGYGYIKSTGSDQHDFRIVEEFVEKPDYDTAVRYVDSGLYHWNSGMFMFKASRYIEELKKFHPTMLEVCELSYKDAEPDLEDFIRLNKEHFGLCPEDSIDYAVMEKTSDAVVCTLDAQWSDVGSWSALWEVGSKDEGGNVLHGDVLLESTKNSYVYAGSKLVATVGMENVVVVDTDDAVLVANKDEVQDVKAIVHQLKRENRKESSLHREVYRPWGSYDSIDMGSRFQVKRITVKPGAKLSSQMHHHRAEHWIVVSGSALVTVGEEQKLLTENQSTYIPIGEVHRLENPGVIPLEMIEVQSGSYLGEDDIVRFDDVYGRS